MGNLSALSKQSGVTPGKLVLVGVLAVLLVGVLYIQFGPGVSDSAPMTSQPSARRKPAVRQAASPLAQAIEEVTAAASTPTRAQIRNTDKWQRAKLASVVQYDPFALPAAFPQPQVPAGGDMAEGGVDPLRAVEVSRADLEKELQQIRDQLETLRRRGVQVIIQRRDEYVAMIGDRTIHVGDEISGFKVINIDSDGIQVARELPQ